MKYIPTEENPDLRASVYYYLISHDPDRSWLGTNVRFAQYDVSVVPTVGDVIEGAFGYRSEKARVYSIAPYVNSVGRHYYDVFLEEIPNDTT